MSSALPASRPAHPALQPFFAVRCAQQTLAVVWLQELNMKRCTIIMVRLEEALKELEAEGMAELADMSELKADAKIFLAVISAMRFRYCILEPDERFELSEELEERQSELLRRVHNKLKAIKIVLHRILAPSHRSKSPASQAARSAARRLHKKQRAQAAKAAALAPSLAAVTPATHHSQVHGSPVHADVEPLDLCGLSLRDLLLRSRGQQGGIVLTMARSQKDWESRVRLIDLSNINCDFAAERRLNSLLSQLQLLFSANFHPVTVLRGLELTSALLDELKPLVTVTGTSALKNRCAAGVADARVHNIACWLLACLDMFPAALEAARSGRASARDVVVMVAESAAPVPHDLRRLYEEGALLFAENEWQVVSLLIGVIPIDQVDRLSEEPASMVGLASMILSRTAMLQHFDATLSSSPEWATYADPITTLCYPAAVCSHIAALMVLTTSISEGLEHLEQGASLPVPPERHPTARGMHRTRHATFTLLCELRHRLGREEAALEAARGALDAAERIHNLVDPAEKLEAGKWLEEARGRLEQARRDVESEMAGSG